MTSSCRKKNQEAFSRHKPFRGSGPYIGLLETEEVLEIYHRKQSRLETRSSRNFPQVVYLKAVYQESIDRTWFFHMQRTFKRSFEGNNYCFLIKAANYQKVFWRPHRFKRTSADSRPSIGLQETEGIIEILLEDFGGRSLHLLFHFPQVFQRHKSTLRVYSYIKYYRDLPYVFKRKQTFQVASKDSIISKNIVDIKELRKIAQREWTLFQRQNAITSSCRGCRSFRSLLQVVVPS